MLSGVTARVTFAYGVQCLRVLSQKTRQFKHAENRSPGPHSTRIEPHRPADFFFGAIARRLKLTARESALHRYVALVFAQSWQIRALAQPLVFEITVCEFAIDPTRPSAFEQYRSACSTV